MRDYPLIKPTEKAAFLVATGRHDPLFQPSEGAIATACTQCGEEVMIDRKSQALMPLPVYCLTCFVHRIDRERVAIRRAR